eukprot:2678737-Rhodomonas_salina.1
MLRTIVPCSRCGPGSAAQPFVRPARRAAKATCRLSVSDIAQQRHRTLNENGSARRGDTCDLVLVARLIHRQPQQTLDGPRAVPASDVSAGHRTCRV